MGSAVLAGCYGSLRAAGLGEDGWPTMYQQCHHLNTWEWSAIMIWRYIKDSEPLERLPQEG
ncbi:hypothetical protein BHECKSOX_911 [Bathymodiolus heckerae thiotrophic gill symbiont]|nr:hypothetical protein BHECKSOX_911 [Bathymodiolus heckerae thiotrophic gill symbiont]